MRGPMSAFSLKYPKEQRRAIAIACVDGVPGFVGRGPGGACSAQQAVDLAAQGLLPGLPAFTFNVSTARHYAQELRREREEQQAERERVTVDGLLDDVGRRLAKIADREVMRLEKASLRNRASIDDARKVAQLVKEVRFAVTRPGKGAGTSAAQDGKPDTGPTGLVARLAAEHTGSTAEPNDPPSTPRLDAETTAETSTDTSPTGHDATDTDAERDGGARRIGVPGSVGGSSGLAAAQRVLEQARLDGATVAQ